jgi:hypothetical protein
MKTEHLIDALVADRAARGRPLAVSLALALLGGAAVSLVLFFAEFGVRTDIAAALATWRFDFKIALVLLSLVLAFGVCRECARPDAAQHPLRRLLPLAAAAALAVVAEVAIVPRAGWMPRLVGTNSMICLTAVPLLSLAPLVAALAVLRRGAPASPALAGAAAGVLAAASGASLYAFHCFDDSPLFVATWYSLGALPVVLLGALAGRRLLRW